MLLASIAIAFFCYQSYTAIATDKVQAKTRTMMAHSVYLLLMITGLVMVWPLIKIEGVPLQWVVAKGVLLLAVMSSSVKAFRPTAEPAQRKMGIFIASVGLAGIVGLAFIKPANLF